MLYGRQEILELTRLATFQRIGYAIVCVLLSNFRFIASSHTAI